MTNIISNIGNVLVDIGTALGGVPREERNLPEVRVIEVPYSQCIDELATLGIEWQRKAKYKPDYIVRHTTLEGWKLILPYLIFSAHWYIFEGADCDDYAVWAKAKASRLFKLHVFETWGTMPLGRHAWNMVRYGEKSYVFFDSNAGFDVAGKLFANGEYGRQAKSWL